MIIDNLEIVFDRQEDNKLFFKTDKGQEVAIDVSLLSNKGQKFYLNLDNKKINSSSKEVLNDILETNSE